MLHFRQSIEFEDGWDDAEDDEPNGIDASEWQAFEELTNFMMILHFLVGFWKGGWWQQFIYYIILYISYCIIYIALSSRFLEQGMTTRRRGPRWQWQRRRRLRGSGLKFSMQKFNDIMKISSKILEEKMHDLMEGKYKERKSHTPQTPSDIKQQHGNIDKSCENFYLILQIIDFLTEWLGDKARQWME